MTPVEFTDGRWGGGGRGWARSQIIRPQESLALYKSFDTLWSHCFGFSTSISNLMRKLKIRSSRKFFQHLLKINFFQVKSRRKMRASFAVKNPNLCSFNKYCLSLFSKSNTNLSSDRQSLFWSEISYNKPPPLCLR